ncbi:SUF system Fe-S cluster assembly protein [Ferrovibrio sp.]|uniref:SUF system Fe-S cluster assembly protein n=1 Tax=Ferrovibrio sp. TaxID=1917215 RepID=UPI003D0FE79B
MGAKAKKPAVAPEQVRDQVIEALKTVYDPEIPVNIFELGLIYKVDVNDDTNDVAIEMTLTSPNCPAAQSMPGEVEVKAREVEGVGEVTVEIVWEPPWTQENMSEAARLELGMM